MIDQATIDRILEAANIVDVVSEFVTLRKRGVNYVGLCPFHADKSPSFYVSPAKNICKCFACGAGGSPVHFIMNHEQLSYFDALRFLAKKYNIEIKERELTEQEKQAHNDRESMLILNSWASNYFQQLLHEHPEGRSVGLRYFAERGLREEIIRKFQLGYSLDQRDALFRTATAAGYKQPYLEKTGLVIPYENGRVNDRFRGRVIFPVHTLSGKVVAFGGRVLRKGEKTAKYVNSPESEIYHKSNELYGLFFAKQAIVKQDKCFLVEGYMDVIGMHQVGVENVVASSGTALTQGQIRLIHRFTENITVLYDGDAAGIKAALRGIDMLIEEGMNVKVVLLPDGEDPDSFARRGATAFDTYIRENETDFIRFKMRLLLQESADDPIKRSAVINDIMRTIAIIPNNIARAVYLRECSETMGIDEQILLREVNRLRLQQERRGNASITHTTPASSTMEAPLPPPPAEPIPPAQQTADTSSPNEPPPFEQIPLEEEVTPQPPQPSQTTPVFQAPSPYEAFEKSIVRYVVRYGERIIFNYQDEQTQEQIQMRLAEYVRFDLDRDGIQITHPLYRQIIEEAAAHCMEEGFTAYRYFLAHPDPQISLLAANLASEKYQLSKYHSKYQTIEPESERLDFVVPQELYALKEAHIQEEIKQVQQQIKESRNEEETMTLLRQLNELNNLRRLLCKQLGERIILRM
ncbi:DNA primase [Parabacteroides distasonis]|nr:DNA primase [Parabacteroides distasonis]